MANGFALGILQHVKEVAKTATPQYKLEPTGLLGSCMLAHSPGVIKHDLSNGHFQTVKIKYKQRFDSSHISDSASCDTTFTQPYLEDTVSVGNYVQTAIHIEDETIAAFEAYASGKVQAGSIQEGLMWEFWDSVMTAASALMEGVNSGLITLATAALGAHRATGNNGAVTVNIPLTITTNPLNGGINKLYTDFKHNNLTGKMIAVGAGLFHGWMVQQAAKGLDTAGIDSRIQAAGIDFFLDYALATALANGDNDIIIYEKDTIQLVEYMKYQGFKAGNKGVSTFGILPLPMKAGNGAMSSARFDMQLKYNDCEETFSYVDGEQDQVLQKGYNLILSKNYGLWTIPSDAYRAADALTGNRGSLRYRITNA